MEGFGKLGGIVQLLEIETQRDVRRGHSVSKSRRLDPLAIEPLPNPLDAAANIISIEPNLNRIHNP